MDNFYTCAMWESVGDGTGDRPGSGRRRHRWGVAVAVAIATIICGMWLVSTLGAGPRPEVGACVQLDGAADDLQVRTVDCADDDQMTWTIAKEVATGDDCPADNYTAVHTDRLRSEADTICLLPKLDVDHCYREVNDVDTLAVVPCAEADFKVESVHNAEDPTLCGDVGVPYAFPEPALTYCLVDPEQ